MFTSSSEGQITYPQVDVVRETFQREGSVYLSKIGFVKIIAHRPFESEKVFQINVIRKSNKWYANLTVELPDPGHTMGDIYKSIGVDVGLLHFYALSDGTTVEAPKFLRKSEQKLGKLQRKLSHKNRSAE